jgi:hypothetical protein
MRICVRIIFLCKVFICWMQALSVAICNYINKEWIDPWKGSIRAFATEHDIDEKTARKIIDFKKKPYSISLYTLEKMCSARDITLEIFFKSIKK